MSKSKKPKDIRQNACTMLLPSVLEDIDRLARETRRSRSQVIAMLVMRGRAAFLRDGSLIEPSEGGDVGSAGVDYEEIGQNPRQNAAMEICDGDG